MAQADPADRARKTAGAALIGALTIGVVLGLAGFGSPGTVEVAGVLPSAGAAITLPTGQETSAPLPSWWPKRLTMYTDSVGLGAVTALRETMPQWRIKVRGRPALMLDDAADEIRDEGSVVDKVVVVALGYNSLWERGGEDYGYWSSVFDRNARRLIRTLHAAGARKIVWVTARDAPRPAIPKDSLSQHRSFAWYFPYVNDALLRLDTERSDVSLADWATIGDRPGITYDAIHLDPDGALLYSRMVRRAVIDASYTPQAAAGRD